MSKNHQVSLHRFLDRSLYFRSKSISLILLPIIKISLQSMLKTNRRYDYIKFGNGRHFGKSMTCSKSRTTHLETYRRWLFYKCSYCYCLCEEGPKFFSERYINMRMVMSNITDNKYVIEPY